MSTKQITPVSFLDISHTNYVSEKHNLSLAQRHIARLLIDDHNKKAQRLRQEIEEWLETNPEPESSDYPENYGEVGWNSNSAERFRFESKFKEISGLITKWTHFENWKGGAYNTGWRIEVDKKFVDIVKE